MPKNADYFLSEALNAYRASVKYTSLITKDTIPSDRFSAEVLVALSAQSQLIAEGLAELIGRIDQGFFIDLELNTTQTQGHIFGHFHWSRPNDSIDPSNNLSPADQISPNPIPAATRIDPSPDPSSEALARRAHWHREVHGTDDPTGS